mgnify:CR=1 FL=1
MAFLTELFNSSQYSELLTSPLFALTLSLAAFQGGSVCYRLSNQFPLFHPTVLGAVLVALALKTFDLNFSRYLQANNALMFLLGPATVALAVPLFQQLKLMRGLLMPMMVTVISGSVVASGSAVLIAYWLGASPETLLSLAPKSITTPIAMSIAEEIGGLTILATGAVVLTAVVGICAGPLLFKWMNISDPRIWGFCLGISAHGVGTARSFEINATAGAFSSLALCLTGTFSAIMIPIAVSFVR